MVGAEVLIRPVLNLFLTGAKKVYEINSLFKPLLKDIIETLEVFEPAMEEIEKSENFSNPKVQDALRSIRSKMVEGNTLVEECSKVTPMQVKKMNDCNKKLVELQNSLQKRLNVLNSYGIYSKKKRITGVAAGAVPDRPSFTIGLETPLKELKMWLRKDGESMFVLTAPGGFGKTTLATEFCHDAEVKGIFQENIFFVRVSKNPAPFNDIVRQLHKRRLSQLASTSRNKANAVNDGLHDFLKEAGEKPKKPLLLVFDDVWCGWESHIEKFRAFKMPNYKILVTSRSEFPRFGSSYHLKSLKKEYALTFFNHLLEDKTSHIPTHRREKILEHCKGHPKAIEVLGRSLCGMPEEGWRTREDELLVGSILDSETQLLECLQTSLDALDQKLPFIKKSFIDLGVFLKDHTIPVAALIDMWAESYEELKDKDYQSITNLDKLTERSLANLVFPRRAKTEMMVNNYGYYSQHFVAQHDLLRDLVIRQTNEAIGGTERLIIDVPSNTFPKWWTEQLYHQPVHARLVSISTGPTDEGFSKKWDKMNLPKAEVLVLNFQAERYALPNFLEKMSKSLKVLIVTNHGLLHANVSKFGRLNYLSNLKRLRLEGISIPSIKKNSIKLKSLQKISLFMCNIDEPSSQILGAFPNLVEMNIDYCNNLKELPAKLCGLKKLKKLSITNCDKLNALPEQIGNLVDLEVLRLLACINLLQLPGSISKLEKLEFFDISDCWSIGRLPDAIGEMRSLKQLRMIHCPGLRMLHQSILNLKQKMEVICDAVN